jgi:hypothetical protein
MRTAAGHDGTAVRVLIVDLARRYSRRSWSPKTAANEITNVAFALIA